MHLPVVTPSIPSFRTPQRITGITSVHFGACAIAEEHNLSKQLQGLSRLIPPGKKGIYYTHTYNKYGDACEYYFHKILGHDDEFMLELKQPPPTGFILDTVRQYFIYLATTETPEEIKLLTNRGPVSIFKRGQPQAGQTQQVNELVEKLKPLLQSTRKDWTLF